jgi:hypothetical protein
LRNAAQRRSWTFYETVNDALRLFVKSRVDFIAKRDLQGNAALLLPSARVVLLKMCF